MASVLADLLIKMDVDSAKLRTELGKIGQDFVKMESGIKKVGDNVRHLLELKIVEWVKEGAVKLYEFAKAGAEAAEKMGRLAQSAGVPVAEFTKLAFAAHMVDMDAGTLAGGLEKLARNMAKAGMGSGDAARAFKVLGVDVKNADGTLRGTREVFLEVAEHFAEMEDGAGKTALAMMIFGRSGADLIPLLNKGGGAIDEFGEKLNRVGKVLTEKVAAGAEKFVEQIKIIEKASAASGALLAANLAKPLEELVDSFLAGADGAKNMKESIALLSDGVKAAGAGVITLMDGVTRLGIRMSLLKQWVGAANPSSLDTFVAATERAGAALAKQEKLYEKRMELLGFGDEEKYAKQQERLAELSKELTEKEEALATAVAQTGEAWRQSPMGGAVNAYAPVKQYVEDLRERIAQLRWQIGDLKKEMPTKSLADSRYFDDYSDWNKSRRKKKAPELPDPDAIKQHDLAVKHLEKTLLDYEKRVNTFGQTESAAMRYEVEHGEIAKFIEQAYGKRSAAAQKYREQLISLADAYTKLKQEEKDQNDAVAGLEKVDAAIMGMNESLHKMDGTLAKHSDTEEQVRMQWRMEEGDLKLVLAAMEKIGLSTAAYRAQLMQLAAALDRKKTADEAAVKVQREHDQALEDGKQILSSMTGPADRYAEAVTRINKAWAAGGLTDAQRKRALEHAEKDFEKAGGQMNEFAKNYSKQMEDILGEHMFNNFNKGLDGMVEDFGMALKRMVAQALAHDVMGAIFNPKGGGGTNALNALGYMVTGSNTPPAGAIATGPQLPATSPGEFAQLEQQTMETASVQTASLEAASGEVASLTAAMGEIEVMQANTAMMTEMSAGVLNVPTINAGQITGGVGGGGGLGLGDFPGAGDGGGLGGDELGGGGVAYAAAGARAMPGSPFVVGEKGLELFVPDSAGRIVPNQELADALAAPPEAPMDAYAAPPVMRTPDVSQHVRDAAKDQGAEKSSPQEVLHRFDGKYMEMTLREVLEMHYAEEAARR